MKFCIFKNIISKILNKYFKLQIYLAGSYRTGQEYSKDIDIIIVSDKINNEDQLKNKWSI